MYARINGTDLAFDKEGSGPPVLLIHGFPLNRGMWRPQVEALTAAGYMVVTPDLRGFGDSPVGAAGGDGGSDKPGETSGGMPGGMPGSMPGSLDLLADDLIALLDHLQIDQAVVGGMSMGGYVLLNLLARYPERIKVACFLVTRADADDEVARAKRDHLISEVGAGRPVAVADAFIQVLFSEEAFESTDHRRDLVDEVHRWLAATSPEGLLLGLLAIRDRADSTALLSHLTLPTLVIGAESDRAIPPERSTDLAAGIPGATLRMIPEAGHMANLERPEAFNRVLLEFFETVC